MKLTRTRGALYLQVKNILKDRILHSMYPLHTNLPSEPELAEEFKVSRITIRNAVKELVQEGFLETNSGKRTRIIRNKSISGRVKGKHFTELLVEQGHQIRKEWIKAETEQNGEDTENNRLFGKQCIRLERIYYLDEKPYIHFTHYLTTDVGNVDLSGLAFQSLYDLIGEQDIILVKFQDQFAVEAAPDEVARLLHVAEKTPLLKRIRFSYDESDRLVEYSIGYYNTDIMHYHVDYV